ncbi:MAG: OstA-like protein, partial [Cyclobacteriaceae bacterium]
MRGYFLLVTVFFLAMSFSGHAQRNKKLQYRADKLEFMKVDGEQMRKLMDNVVFTQKTTTIYCDSSYFYPKENRMEAFGRVRIVDDTVVITSRKLTYDGENRKALLRENVIY